MTLRHGRPLSASSGKTLASFLFLGLLLVQIANAGETVSDDAVSGDHAADAPAADPSVAFAFKEDVKPLLKKFCVDCHGKSAQKGDRRFDRLTGEIADDDALVDYQDVLDQLNLGEMPPEDSKQPTNQQRQRAIDWLTNQIQQYHQTSKGSGGDTVLRRLNAREYRNTVRDLLHLNMTMFDPTEKFPRDQTSERLDNVGDTLVTSGFLLARHLEAADRVIEKALQPLQKPPVRTWTFRDDFRQQPEIDQVHRRTNHFKHMTLYDVVGADKHEGAYGPILNFAEGVPFDGTYEIRLKAEAVNRINPYDSQYLGTDPSEPLRLGIVAGNHLVGNLHLPQPVEPLLAEIDLADQPKWYTCRVWLDAGYTPRFTFQNGLMDARNLWSRLIKKYRDQFPKDIAKGIVAARFNAIKHGKLPQIHIHEIEIEGPLFERWPTQSQRALLGEQWNGAPEDAPLNETAMRARVESFASRAYRRPVTSTEIDRIMDVIADRQAAGRSPTQAYADGLKVILCSPNFLYLEEPEEGAALSSSALASRLSYFLWSSMPDQQLLDLAKTDRLRQPEILRQQVARMLKDPKSDAFVDGFLGSWLGLRELGATPPDRGEFRDFYHYDLDTAMRRETFLFTRHVLDENLGLVNFLDSDFTFVNKPLARLYGLNPPSSGEFERVEIQDPTRGGLLGQASILTLTANGIDTSPVVRGVWLLENLLGTPPSPPPPDVEPLDPDIRGAVTIRDQLEKHRTNPSCYDCHRKIDPLGFALENFDPIGRWRTNYEKKKPIDASGELPGGNAFRNVEGLKEILVAQQDQFAKAVTEKLLAYAIGRHTEATDRPHIDAILQEARGGGYRFADIVEQIVLSEPFGSK